MALLLPLSVQLQKSSLVIGDAMMKVKHFTEKLVHMKENTKNEFHTHFVRTAKEAEESMGLVRGLTPSQRVGRQVHTNAVPGATVMEEYYRRNVFILFLDDAVRLSGSASKISRSTLSSFSSPSPAPRKETTSTTLWVWRRPTRTTSSWRGGNLDRPHQEPDHKHPSPISWKWPRFPSSFSTACTEPSPSPPALKREVSLR